MTQMLETSLDAYYKKVLPKKGTRYAQIINEFKNHPKADLTNNELASLLHLSICSITGRVKELRDMGFLVASQKRQCEITKFTVYAWRLNQ
jgi:Mn-dependent DtxR family transcriptional regulator